MIKISLRYKLTAIHLGLITVVVVVGSFFTILLMQRYFHTRLTGYIQTQLAQVQYMLNHSVIENVSQSDAYQDLTNFAHAAGYRLTLIDSIGVVYFDSNVSMDSLRYMDNHLDRPEIQQAINEEFGTRQRLSATLDEPFHYVAKRILQDGMSPSTNEQVCYIRIAYPLSIIDQQFCDLRIKIFIANTIGLVLIGILSLWLTGRLAYPIQKLAAVAEKVKRGDLQANFQHHSRDEIGQLADLLNQMLSKLREDLVKLRKLEQVRSQFLGNVSHELRTPIFTLQGYLETLLNNTFHDPQRQKEFITKAYQQAGRLNNLLTDLIDISRIESGEMKMIFRPFDVHYLLAKQTEELQNKARDYHVTISFANSKQPHRVKAMGDVDRITQVMLNLIENAIKYNVPNGQVEIGYVESAQEIEIYVKDSGRGIPEQHIPRIFERFYRVDKERSRAVGGTGLGLAIVKHIIEAHGSQIKVQSQLDQGSRFSFLLRKASE
ncbi:HAMP domain-containing protein [candidate division KSB1 bacterium]|nr:HAMP domain-containing protein [candidate division KSB1 bacterium]